MKSSDITTVGLIGVIGIIGAYFLVNALLPQMSTVSFKTIQEISSTLAEPSDEVFNSAAINPTMATIVGTCDADGDGVTTTDEYLHCGREEEKEEDKGDSSGELKPDEEENEGENENNVQSNSGNSENSSANNSNSTNSNSGNNNSDLTREQASEFLNAIQGNRSGGE